LEVYVDQAGVFMGNKEDSVTRIGQRLKFYDVSFVFANTPEAKGKVERIHQVWQDRLPPYFALNGLTPSSDLEEVNRHIHVLCEHRNRRERHRELGMTPQAAWEQATAQGRNKLRPVPKDPWWNYVWSLWHPVTIALGGRVHFGQDTFPTQGISGTRAVLCQHLDGSVSILKERPDRQDFSVLTLHQPPSLTPPVAFRFCSLQEFLSPPGYSCRYATSTPASACQQFAFWRDSASRRHYERLHTCANPFVVCP
jgi:hypothetical protein